MTKQHLWITIVALVGAVAVPAALSLKTSNPGSPQKTIETFLRAAASGEGAKACAQLSPAAKAEVVQGARCEDGIRLGASIYGSIIGQLKIADLRITRDTATASSTLSGQPTATFELRKRGDRWLIVHEQRVSAATTAADGSQGPSQSRVESVAACLDHRFGAVDDAGLDSTGGISHAVLSVGISGYSAAEVDVFSTALAAVTGFPGIRSYEKGLTTRIAGGSVIVYLKPVAAPLRHAIEACG